MRSHPRRRLVLTSSLAALAVSIPLQAAERERADLLADPATLPQLLAGAGKDTTLLDCRPRKDYEAARVAGARWVDLAQLKTLPPAKNALAQPGAWLTWCSEHGIRPDGRVIVYDDGGMTEAARVWFLLQLQGLRRVSVLDGGFPELKPLIADGRLQTASGPIAEPETTPPPSASPASESGSCPVDLADKQATLASVDRKDTVILDVRSEEEYLGTDREKNPRHGHLPSAVNLPHTRLLVPSAAPPATQPATAGPGSPATQPAAKVRGRLKSVPDLRKLFDQAGIRPDRRVVVHCQSGGRAALVALALARAGYDNVSNYYGSFGEWSADANLPVVASTQPAGARPHHRRLRVEAAMGRPRPTGDTQPRKNTSTSGVVNR